MFFKGLEVDGLEEELLTGEFRTIVEEDDIEKLKKYIEDEKLNMEDPDICCTIFDVCVYKAANKCCLYMLNHPSFNSNYVHLVVFSPTILSHIVNKWEDPVQVLKLMFEHHHADLLSNKTYFGIHPIHSILVHTMNAVPFCNWFKGDSIIKLIILIISARKARPRLECARLVADNTSLINEVALGLFYGGDVKELAALLLLAYDKVFHPLKSDLPTVSDDGLPTISAAQMVSQAIHGGIPDVYSLVYLFHKAGRDLSNLYTSMPEDDNPADVILKVATLIKNAGFPITYRDVDLAYEYSFKPGVINSICEALGGVDPNNGINLGNKKPQFPSVYCIPRCPRDVENKYFGQRRHDHMYLPRVRQYCTAPQNKKISASKPASSGPPLSRLAFLAVLLKRGLRLR